MLTSSRSTLVSIWSGFIRPMRGFWSTPGTRNRAIRNLPAKFILSPTRSTSSLSQLALAAEPMAPGNFRSPASYSQGWPANRGAESAPDQRAKEISLEGQVAFGGAQNVSLLVNGFDLADLNPFLPSNPALAGTLSIRRFRITGTSAMPMVSARMRKSNRSRARGYTLQRDRCEGELHQWPNGGGCRDLPGRESPADRECDDSRWSSDGTRSFVAYASGGINGRVHSNGISLAFLNSMSSAHDPDICTASVSMDVALTGPIKHPQANGGDLALGRQGQGGSDRSQRSTRST